MPDTGVILVTRGMIRFLDICTAAVNSLRWMGLMKGTAQPLKSWTIANISVCTFSGYGGLQPLLNWSPATLDGLLAVSDATPLVWQHDGGAGSCLVTGNYVVDGNGQLHWVEYYPEPWEVMAYAGQRHTVVPRFAQGSRYPVQD